LAGLEVEDSSPEAAAWATFSAASRALGSIKRKLDKDVFLAELLKGKTRNQVFREYGRTNCSSVYKWCDRDPVFKAAYRKIMDERKAPQAPEAVESDNPEEVLASWKERFLFYFGKSDDRINGAERAGVMLSEVFETLDKNSPKYDEDFALAFREIELKQAVRIEDDMRRKALVESKDDTQKFLLPTLPIIGEKYRKGTKEVPQQNFLAITFTHAGHEQAERQLLKVLKPSESITETEAQRMLGR
jgi:hypothetical protein